MDRFTQMLVFQAVVEEEGFAAASRQLKMSPPAVTRMIAALEHRLGIQLLIRTTRHVRPTEAGLRYLEDTRRILEEVSAADEAAAGVNAVPRGKLRVTAPVLFGRMFVTPSIVRYLKKFPDMRVEALFVDRIVNLVEEGLDVGLRIGELPDSSFRALPVGSVRHVLVASPEYIAEYGLPPSPRELRSHRLISSGAGSFSESWRFQDEEGEFSIRVNPNLWVSTNDAAIEAAAEGFGISRVISYQVAQYTKQRKLKIILSEYERATLPIHVIHREGRGGATKVRSFIDLLAEDMRGDPMLNRRARD